MNAQENYDWMVYVSCRTFNQAPYIDDALNGFTMQETSFPYVCCIVDDASTDGEQEVINNYLNEHFDLEDKKVVRQEETDDYFLTFAQHRTNVNCYFAVLFLKYNHYSIKKPIDLYLAQWCEKAKYIAICEGDDHWIVSDKLQKQVCFLEENSEYVLIHTDYTSVDSEGHVLNHSFNSMLDIPENVITNRIFEGYYCIRTLTICYRNINGLLDINLPKDAFRGDKFLFYMLSQKGKVKYLDEITGNYRILPESASHFKKKSEYRKFSWSLFRLDYFMADYLNINDEVRERLNLYWYKKALVSNNYGLITELRKDRKNIFTGVNRIYGILNVQCVFILLSYAYIMKAFIKKQGKALANYAH